MDHKAVQLLKALGALAAIGAAVWAGVTFGRAQWGAPDYMVYPPGVECDSVQTTSTGCILAYKDGMRIALVCGSYAVVTED